MEDTAKNTSGTSFFFPPSTDSSRNLRLKMSGAPRSGFSLPSGPSTMKIPSLLQKLPVHGNSVTSHPSMSSNGVSEASAVTLSALSVLENGPEEQGTGGNFPLVNLDCIDLDNITVGNLQGLHSNDADTLRAKYLNKLSPKEREHVLQDVHGVADFMEEAANIPILDDLLKELQGKIEVELETRKAKTNVDEERNGYGTDDRLQEDITAATSSLLGDATTKNTALKEQLGKLQQELDDLIRQRNNLDSSINGGGEFTSRKQLSAKNHPMFGKLGDMGGFGSYPFGSNSNSMNQSKNNLLPASVPSSRFGGSSSFFCSTFGMNSSANQEDASILKNKDAMAYEQALAQCRRRCREQNSSIFRHNSPDDKAVDGDALDEGRYIDVEQSDFRLSFLRAERFDTKKAATRMIDYFEEKRRLFGVENLTTKIQLKDLDADSKNCFESGQIQLLPGRDRAGRAVIVETKKLASSNGGRPNENSILRALWVLSSIALEDVETEKNGVVFVKYDIGGARERNEEAFAHRMRNWGNVLKALPLRISSMHWCVDNHALKQSANLWALMLGGSIFVRVRCHAGNNTEVLYELMSAGIPTDLFPVSMHGQIELGRHLDFLQRRKKMEASTLLSKALALVEAPMFDDCAGLDVCDGNQNQDGVIGSNRNSFLNAPMMSSANMNNNDKNGFHQNHSDYQQDNGFVNNNMNKLPSPSFSDPFCFGRNPMQMQACMQQQFEQRRQQQLLKSFQQQNRGMNMNTNMVQQFPQGQQAGHQQASVMNSDSKSGMAFSREPVLVPGELDILLGRGRGAQNHKGNIHYRQVVETFRSRYEQIPQKGAKTQLIREVVAVIYDNGGRFLKQDGSGRWIPVDPEVARDKVSHSFRNQKRLSIGGAASNSESKASKKRSRDE